MIEQTANHLWQSSLVAALAGLLTLTFRRHRAQVRYWLWLAASLKFLIPFAALTALGRQFGWRLPGALVQPQMTLVVDAVALPFSQPVSVVVSAATAAASPGGAALTIALAAIWLGGCLMILTTWWVRWRRVDAAVRQATPVSDGSALAALRRLAQQGGITTPIALVSSDSPLEPGVFGILKPVLLWPRQIADRLDDEQIEAILAHELSHVRRRDNLAAALHMIVEALFWFHPLVWWMGSRLVDERERACDEEVIRLGSERQVYAESILKTCEFYVESRLVCVAGVTGSDLSRRIEAIMSHDAGRALSAWGRGVLGAAAAAVIATPVVVGALNAPRLRAQPAATAGPSIEIASITPNRSGDRRVGMLGELGGRFTAINVTPAMLIQQAYRLQGGRGGTPAGNSLLVGAPGWLYSDHFDIVAKTDPNAPADASAMLKTLLSDRFKLTAHLESRERQIYALVMASSTGKPGPGFQPSAADCSALAAARGRGAAPESAGGLRGMPVRGRPEPGGPLLPAPSVPGERPRCGMRLSPGNMIGGGVTLAQLANTLSPFVNRIVMDRTGLEGGFDLDLKWTPDLQVRSAPAAVVPGSGNDADRLSIFTAVQEQLGLRLEPTEGQVTVVVIDHIEPPTED